MATAGQRLSPGGALLRASRMFSLPSALPGVANDKQTAINFYSDTATKPYPTLQTVTVPEHYRKQGDWGFKRQLPLKTTIKTSTPLLRISHVDTIEHITDFASAADHTLSLEKWQELNIAVSMPHPTDTMMASAADTLQSVFEDKFDFTALDAKKIEEAGNRRWKYRGPWLADLSEGEFQAYIKQHVRGRRQEFRDFLRRYLAPEMTKSMRQDAMDRGLDQSIPDLRPEDVTDSQLVDWLRWARFNRGKLYELVGKFLDLAPIENRDLFGNMAPDESKVLDSNTPYAKSGPPSTHPSAGLSYLRTNAFLENHPVYGPQRYHKPAQSRILSVKSNPVVGIGGFVTPSRVAETQYKRTGLDQAHFERDGGAKTWLNVLSAQVDSKGRAILNVEPANTEAAFIQRELQGKFRLFHGKALNPQRNDQQPHTQPRSSKLVEKKTKYKLGGPSTYGAGWSNATNRES